MANDNELLIKINGDAKSFLTEVDRIDRKTKDLRQTLEKTAKVSAIAFAGFAIAIGGITKAFIDYEPILIKSLKSTLEILLILMLDSGALSAAMINDTVFFALAPPYYCCLRA